MSVSPLDRLLGMVLDLISNTRRKEVEEKSEKNEPQAEPVEKEEKGSSSCPHAFGYLFQQPKSVPIPEECLTCQKMLECRTS